MSIGEFAMGEGSLSEQSATSAKKKAPPKRQTRAKADVVLQPEAR